MEKATSGNSYFIYQAVAALCVGLGNMGATMALGYTSPALPSMRADPDLHLTTEQESWVGAVMPLAALFGSILAGPLVDNLGRRATFLHLTIPTCLSWALIARAEGVGAVVCGRVLGGLCVGVVMVVGSVFMPEIVQVEHRNTFAAFPAFFGNFGMLVSFAAGQLLSWRGLAWLGAAVPLIYVPLLLALPETPHHLTRTGQREASLKALKKLRESTSAAEKEQQEVEESIAGQQTGQQEDVGVMEMFRAPHGWPVGVAVGLMVAQQTTGISAVVFFASSILAAAGEDMAASASVVLAAVNMLGTAVGIYCVATMKRRQSLLHSSRGVVAALVVLGAFFWAREAGGSWQQLAHRLYLVPVAALVMFMLCFSAAWGPVPWVFLGEGLPSAVRGNATGMVVAVNWAAVFLVTKSFAWCLGTLGTAQTFLAYAAVTAAATALLRPVMPETFGKSSLEMDRLYQGAAAAKKEQ